MKRNVEALETWLQTVLIDDEGAKLKLIEPMGSDFLSVASESLRSLRALSKSNADRHFNIGNLWLSDFQALAAIRASRNFKEAADKLECKEGEVRRKIKRLEGAFGIGLVEGHSLIRLTSAGERAETVLSGVSVGLIRQISSLREGSKPEPMSLRRLRLLAIKRKAQLSIIVARATEKSAPRKQDRENLKAAQESMVWINELIERLAEYAPQPSGRDIVV